MTTQLTDRARKAAEEIVDKFSILRVANILTPDITAIIERHMRKTFDRNEIVEQALTDAYAKLDAAKGILGKVL